MSRRQRIVYFLVVLALLLIVTYCNWTAPPPG